MKTISCLKDLEDFGIYCLTGEACGLMMRILCDFDERGAKVLARRFGVPEFKGSEPWNTSTKGHKHVGSVMLCHDDYTDIGVFGLLMSGYKWAYRLGYRESPDSSIKNLKLATQGLIKHIWEAEVNHNPESESQAEMAVQNAKEALKNAAGSLGGFYLNVYNIYGFTSDEEKEAQEWLELCARHGFTYRGFAGSGTAQEGFRNRHEFTGRIE